MLVTLYPVRLELRDRVGLCVGVHLCVCVCWERHCSLSVLVSVCVWFCIHWFGVGAQPCSWLDPQAETAAAASIKLRWKVPYSESAGLWWSGRRNPMSQHLLGSTAP